MSTEGDMRKQLAEIKSQAKDENDSRQRPAMKHGDITTYVLNRPHMQSGDLLNEGENVKELLHLND